MPVPYKTLYALIFLFLLLLHSSSFAHDAFSSKTVIRLSDNKQLHIGMKLAAVTVEPWVSVLPINDKQLSSQNQKAIEPYLLEKAKTFYDIRSGSAVLSVKKAAFKVVDNDDAVYFDLVYANVNSNAVLKIRSNFIAETNPEYKSTISVFDANGEQISVEVHSVDNVYSEIPLVKEQSKSALFKTFFDEGIHHIFIGYDHLLFLLALLIVCQSLRAALLIISFFTLAHSLTLALAALQVVQLPSSWVELMIAMSIVYVGVENLYFKYKPKYRWVLTGIFGLIHGLGFASVLREIGLGSEGTSLWLPLLAFNLGVEIGQLILAMIFLPVFLRIRRFPFFEARLLPFVNIAVICVGAFWVLLRI